MKAMRTMLIVLAALVALSTADPGIHGTPRASAVREPIPATDVTAADIEATLKQQIASGKPVMDTPIRVVDAGPLKVGIGLVYRLQAKTAASHDNVAEVYHVLEGSGTFVTGGVLVNPERRENLAYFNTLSGPGITGASIQGGVSRHLGKGDVVVIPAGTPHWFSEIQSPLTYLVVRMDTSKQLTLK
jgi:mannose-6-phosphate isomerase-like protein (cupin superfamily)